MKQDKKQDIRTYWSVTTMTSKGVKETGKYRSRHSTPSGVKAEFAKHKHAVVSVKRWKA